MKTFIKKLNAFGEWCFNLFLIIENIENWKIGG